MNPNISLDANNLLVDGSDALIFIGANEIISTDAKCQLKVGYDNKVSTKPNAYGASFITSSWVLNADGFYEIRVPDTVHQLGTGIKLVEVLNDEGYSMRDGFFQIAQGFAVQIIPASGEVIIYCATPFDGEFLITSYYY